MASKASARALTVRRSGCALVLLCGGALAAAGQGIDPRGATSARAPSSFALERMLRLAHAWDANDDQIFTCDEWKKFVTGIFNQADRNRDGFVDAQEFKSIQNATPQFKDASLDYFDDNRDGRLSRAEFVDTPNPFFLQFDRNRDCKVTLDEIMEASKPADGSRPPR